MNSSVKTVLLIVGLLFLLLAGSSLFIVHEGQEGIMLRLGEIATDKQGKVIEYGPGLHFKYPFINSIRYFDIRLQTLDIKSSRIVTKEKKDVIVDYYVKWWIDNSAQYYKATGGSAYKAQVLLEQKLNSQLRAEFGKRKIVDVVSGERDDIMDILQKKADEQARGLGIKVKDVRIKAIDLPPSTTEAIYRKMRTDMEKIANRHRADGKRDAEEIEAKADATVSVMLAKAKSQGNEIRAQGQAKAAAIYAQAYKRNQDFFAFYRSLQAYKQSFASSRDILILDDSSQFFDYFKQSSVKALVKK